MKKVSLFPLPVVLYPDSYLSLQVFELRYRRMVKECLRDGIGFIVVQSFENTKVGGAPFYNMGTYGEIYDWHPLPDEMIGIQVKGLQKAIIHSYSQSAEDGLIVGEVELLREDERAGIEHRYDMLVQLLKGIQAHPLIAALPFDIDYNDASDVSYRLAESLPFTPREKQQMLELDNAHSRLEFVLSVLTELN